MIERDDSGNPVRLYPPAGPRLRQRKGDGTLVSVACALCGAFVRPAGTALGLPHLIWHVGPKGGPSDAVEDAAVTCGPDCFGRLADGGWRDNQVLSRSLDGFVGAEAAWRQMHDLVIAYVWERRALAVLVRVCRSASQSGVTP